MVYVRVYAQRRVWYRQYAISAMVLWRLMLRSTPALNDWGGFTQHAFASVYKRVR